MDEAEQVVTLFRDHYNIPLIHADESERFLGALDGRHDPEVKRKTIGKLFIDVFEEKARKRSAARDFLAQGTLYPDVIESVSAIGGPSVTIKSHHNVGGLPERMNMKLVEPLRESVQGRSARARARAWACRRRSSGAIRSRGRAWPSACRARSRTRSSTFCARPMRSISTRSARPGFTIRSGRRSPCCCR